MRARRQRRRIHPARARPVRATLTATVWVATILKECPRALDDGRISLAELRSVVVAGGEPPERRCNEDLYARAEGMLREAM